MEVINESRPDGVVIDILNPRWALQLQEWGIPTVNVGCRNDAVQLPRVSVDDVMAGKMAASYLAERGFRNFAYYGRPTIGYSREREEGFVSELRRLGHTCDSLDPGVPIHRIPQDRDRQWVARLPKPVALFAAKDQYGLAISDACRQMSISVPDEVAILAMDNHELICHMAHPALSTIISPTDQIGREAALMLDRLMAGRPLRHNGNPLLLPPPGIITRQSTDVMAVADPLVAEVVRLIRDQASRPLGVKELLRHVPVSRRVLERRFVRALGRTPLTEIRRAHIERAKELLANPGLRTDQVAEQSGLRSAAMLAMTFRKATGETPSEYRRGLRKGLVDRVP
jgi:LacI family transcriptional regulator